jgi:hypothetical protein
MWTYNRRLCLFAKRFPPIELRGSYSGHGEGLNNPALEKVPNVGPLPAGLYLIGRAQEHGDLGKVVMSLTPFPSTDVFGRSAFFIHGDDVKHPGEEIASHGCIVTSRSNREAIRDSNDYELEVI